MIEFAKQEVESVNERLLLIAIHLKFKCLWALLKVSVNHNFKNRGILNLNDSHQVAPCSTFWPDKFCFEFCSDQVARDKFTTISVPFFWLKYTCSAFNLEF